MVDNFHLLHCYRESNMKCKECGNELKQIQPEIEDIFTSIFCVRVPFTNIKFIVLNDVRPSECENCLCEERESVRRDREENAYDAGWNDCATKNNL